MRFKKIISGILTFAIILGTVPQINAEAPIAVSESAGMSLSEENMQISGTNSFGNMVAQELAEVSSEQEANNGCNVFSVEMSGKTASVSFDTLQDSAIVVAIYDNEGMKMITSGYKEVTAEETETEVKISGTIPQYFYIRAYLVNPDTLRPLSTEYNSPMYTREMQEFLSKTTADFDPDRVLNLDDNPDTNFAVFSEDTTLIHENGKTNVVSADEAALTYVFENPDDDLLTLDVGRVFAFEYNGELVILKAVTVKKNIDEDSGKMTSVTVVGQEAELEEAFEHLRIDGEANTDKAEIDYSNMGEGITCDGLIEDVDNEEDEFSINAIDIDIEGKTSKSIKFNIEEKGNIGSLNEFNFSASINLKLEPSTKLYLSFSEIYIEFKLDYSAKVTIEFEIKGTFLSKELPLAYIMIPIIPEVLNMSITPAFVIELSGKATLEGKLSGTVGFKVSQDGIENLTSSPKFSAKAGIEVTIFIGFSLKPQLFLIHESIVDMNLKAKVGVEIKVEKRLSTDDMDNTVRHECNSCIDGEIKGKYTIDFTVKLLDLQQLEFKVSLLDISAHISDFYFSFTFNEFAFSNCPHYEYLTNIKVVNNACDSIHKANITIDEDDSNVLVTNVLGNVQVWLAKGNHDVKITADGYMSRNASVNINTGGQSFRVIIKKSSDMSTSDFFGGILDDFKSGSSNPNDLDYGKAWDLIVKYVSLGEANSAAITLDGSLYMWGFNRYGEIGDGTWEDKSVPIKIMDNVSSVSLGGNRSSAAITTDGSLYVWGDNHYGQLGDGTWESKSVPIKIMDNVSSVSLGYDHSAAITTDGSLYMWGYNDHGQLGDGTIKNKSVPIKIMDNISSVSLGYDHSAAITYDGSLYMWGNNSSGQLGDGTSENRSVPVKIMNNVSFVSLGRRFSAAITADRNLCMWGSNHYGQIGDGTRMINKKVPVEIMDNVFSVSLGSSHSAAITADGNFYMWGCNEFGELGNESE